MLPRYFLLVAAFFIPQILAENCTTPNDKVGQCIPLYSCPEVINVLATKQNAAAEFLRKSMCGSNGTDVLVCCGGSPDLSDDKDTKSHDVSYNVSSLIPDRRYCGYQHSDDYFRPENYTGINEFPWLAALHYQRDNENETRALCGATLITNRYVLTAAHCILPSEIRNNTLVGVRLGEYNVKTEKDCIDKDTELEECSDPPEDFDIEKVIPHPISRTDVYAADIGLLRLSKRVTYTDYIRPICLPTPGTKFAKPGDILSATGWGRSTIGAFSERKKKILAVLTTNDECVEAYNKYGRNITENHLCTTQFGLNAEFTCKGDSGGPVMFSFKNQWHVEGVTSFGSNMCGSRFPEVSTRVVNYLDWILSNIEP